MRALSATEAARLAAAEQAFYLRVEVESPDGVLTDLATLGGADWLVDATLAADIDQPVVSGTVRVKRASGALSTAPLMAGSTINRDSGNAYAPFLNVGRKLRISVASLAAGETPAAGDWRELLVGHIDNVEAGDDPIVLTFRDLGGVLQDAFIEEERAYSTTDGTAVETIMQQLIDDTLGPGVVTLAVPTSPNWMIGPYKQAQVSVLDAVRALAQQIGWDVRYLHDASDGYALTFYSPDRAKSTPDATIGPDHYLAVQGAALDISDVRNVVRIRYYNSSTATVESYVAEDAGSIAVFGRRYMEIGAGSTTNIDQAVEAQAMGDAAIADLAAPKLVQSIEDYLWWAVQLGDLYRWAANGVHYDEDQDLAVVSYRHTFAASGKARTVFGVRGTVAGAYRAWLAAKTAALTPSAGAAPTLGPLRVEATAFGGQAGREGMLWLPVRFTTDVERIEVFTAEDESLPIPVPHTDPYRALTLWREDGETAGADDAVRWVMIATTAGWYRRVELVPYSIAGKAGPLLVAEGHAVDVGTPPVAPTWGGVARSEDDVLIQWTPHDTNATHLLLRNGVPLIELGPYDAEFTDRGVDMGADHLYNVVAMRSGQSSAPAYNGLGTGFTAPARSPNAPMWLLGAPVGMGFAAGITHGACLIQWGPRLAGATFSRIETAAVGARIPAWTQLGPDYGESGLVVSQDFPAGTQRLMRIWQRVSGVDYYTPVALAEWGCAAYALPILYRAEWSASGYGIIGYVVPWWEAGITVDLQRSANGETGWTTIHSFTPVTYGGSEDTSASYTLGSYVRARVTYPNGGPVLVSGPRQILAL